MNENELIAFKGKKNGITIILDAAANFEELKSVFTQKVCSASDFFGDSKIAVDFSGRALSQGEKEELLNIIKKESSIDVSEKASEAADKEGEIRKRNNGLKAKQAVYTAESGFFSGLNNTVYHKGSLRSGQAMSYDGSIVVLGDVNPGAVLTAQGNIIVLGSLKGFVHAGCKGDDTCFISALNLSPIQIRIADIITYIPPEMNLKNKQAHPSYAYVENGRIYIARLI